MKTTAAKIIDGKALSATLLEEIRQEVISLKTKSGIIPHLAAVLVGDDGASQTYVGSKIKTCEKVGFRSSLVRLPLRISGPELKEAISRLNRDPEVHGIIVQLPLPPHIQVREIIESIDPVKDVDGFHPLNIGKLVAGEPCPMPATPYGIIKIFEKLSIPTSGKSCVVLGRSNIVGRPLSILLSRDSDPGNCTVTLCHSRTQNLQAICASADILIASLGKPLFVGPDMVKEGAVVIDVGITRILANNEKGYEIVGDVDFKAVFSKAGLITPVPGGVGPMTIVALLTNTLRAAAGY